MNEWLDLSDGGWWQVAGWTMLHFLWLGTLVGLAAGVGRLVLRRTSASVRYLAALACFLALAALPIGIGAWLAGNQPASETLVAVNDGGHAMPSAPGSAGGVPGTVSADGSELPTPIATRQPAIATHPSANPRQSRGLTDVFAQLAGYLPWAWLTGTPLTFLLLTTAVIGAERLRRSSRILDDGPIAEACAELARSLRIGRDVTVAICERIAAPVLIGVVRPMILLPSSALSGWSPEEIEMVLLHELAHVRRWDNLVNLLQRFVEAALFFHPAVWLVSRWVRAEREACCDAVVVGRTNRPHAYAEMLVALAAQLPRSVLFHPAATSAMAAGPLRGRIHHILALDSDPMLISGKSLGVVMSGVLLAATLVVLNLPTSTHAEDEPAKKSIPADDPTLVDVPFEVGATKFADGDGIKIIAIRGTANALKPGNEYWIKGTYTLRSQDRATLGAWVTAPPSTTAPAPHDPDQSIEIARGSREFTLKLPMHQSGWPHVSFYPADRGQSFGGVYFGTGDNVLHEWWKDLPRYSVSYGDTRIETEAVRQELKRQAEAMNQLKSLALALLNYHDVKGSLPANASYDSFDRPLLSWRVHILPYLDEKGAAELYQEFRLDEPWDSEHNRALISRMPAVFQNPNRPPGPFTNYVAVVGSDCVFNGTPKGTSLAQIPDGTANTIMLVEADDGVEWTRPADLEVNPQLPPVGVGGFRPNGWLAVFADGSVSLIGKDKSLREVRDLFTCGRKEMASKLADGRADRSIPSSLPLAAAIEDFILRAKADEIGRAQPELTEQEVLSAIQNFDWDAARVEPRIREIFRNIAETHTLPPGATLEFITRVENRSGSANGWWVSLSVMTDQDQGYSLPIRVPSPIVFKSEPDDRPKARFPTLDEQKQADLAWKRLGLEFTPLPERLMKNQSKTLIDYVREQGYDGGVLVAVKGNPRMEQNDLQQLDILVGLHAWPVTSMEDLSEILSRNDLAELSPLKFYALHVSEVIDDGRELQFEPVTGRIYANLDDQVSRRSAPAPQRYSADWLRSHRVEGLAELVAPQPAQAQPLAPDAQPGVTPLQPLPRVVQATRQPIHFDAAEPSTGPEPRFNPRERDFAADPHLAMLNEQLMQAQRQLHAGVVSGDDSRLENLKKHVDTLQRKIHERVKQLERQATERSEPGLSTSSDVPPSMGELKAKLRDRLPLTVVFFYVDDSESCQRTGDMLQQFQRKYINLPLDVVTKDAEVERSLAVKYDIERVPALLFVDGDNQVLKKSYGDITESQFVELLLETSEVLPAVSPSPPTMRYQDKTFDDWRTAWQTELSLEKRLEVVKALAAFGASGRGQEAAEAILDVANQLDWSHLHDSAKGRLQQACIDAFTSGEVTDGYRIPSEVWFPLIVPIVEKSGDKFTFASYLVNQFSPGEKKLIPQLIELANEPGTRNWALQALKAVDPKLEDERVLAWFREAMRQKELSADDAQTLIYYLSYPKGPLGGREGTAMRYLPELEPFLFDTDEETRRKARLAIVWIQPADARELVKRLTARLADESDKDRTEVIRALAAIGKQSLPAESRLEKIALSSSDPNQYAAAVALERIRDNQDDAHMNLGINIGTTPFATHHRQLEAERSELFPDGHYPPRDQWLGGGGGVF